MEPAVTDSEVKDPDVPKSRYSGPQGQAARDEVPSIRGVVRIDIDGLKQTHGWQARVYFGKTARSQFFSDSKFGGNVGAHAAAVAALEQMEAGYRRPKRENSRNRRR